MIGTCWTDMHQDSNPTLFLVQDGRLYTARRHETPRHANFGGGDDIPWRPFQLGEPTTRPPTT